MWQAADARVRPNQIFAVGGLPYCLVGGERARAVVAAVERELLTPMGLRTLARSDPHTAALRRRQSRSATAPTTRVPCGRGSSARSSTRGSMSTATMPRVAQKRRQRFLAPLLAHLDVAGLGHVSEIADGDPPHTPRGCPFQAWSLGELIRALARTEPSDS